jgi:integrase
MAVVKDLNQAFVDNNLICPLGVSKIEYVDPARTGLYILVHASSPGQGTYFVRHKNLAGKTCHAPIGKTTEMTLQGARAATAAFRASLSQPPAQPAAVPPGPPNVVVADSTTGADGSMLLDTFMTEHYFPYIKSRKRSAKRDEQLYRLRIKAKFGNVPLGAITRRSVEAFGDALAEGSLSYASANQHMQLLRRVCNLAVGWDMLERNPLNGIKLFHLDNQRDAFLKDNEVSRLVELCKTHENRMVSLIVMFLLSTGARLREGLCARWDQIDVAKAVWKIPATNSKSKKVKHLPLNSSALWAISQLTSEGKSPYLFPSPATGKPYTTITRAWYVIRRKAELPPKFRLHDLRHTFASRLVSAGRSLYEVQTLLGHADPRTSQRYAHLSMARAQEASNAAAFAIA